MNEDVRRVNRSMPPGAIIAELAYADVAAAAAWLCEHFGFTERLRIGDHRRQLTFDGASVVVVQGSADRPPVGHALMVSVADVDSHYERVRRSGARVSGPPTDFPYGERQYSAQDPGGHHWTFSQSIADVDPASWGGVLLQRDE
jgi:uncharacterized glyoxalase superfamily protein PhnB